MRVTSGRISCTSLSGEEGEKKEKRWLSNQTSWTFLCQPLTWRERERERVTNSISWSLRLLLPVELFLPLTFFLTTCERQAWETPTSGHGTSSQTSCLMSRLLFFDFLFTPTLLLTFSCVSNTNFCRNQHEYCWIRKASKSKGFLASSVDLDFFSSFFVTQFKIYNEII